MQQGAHPASVPVNPPAAPPDPGKVYRCTCGCGQILFSMAPDGTMRMRCHKGEETTIAAVAQFGIVRR